MTEISEEEYQKMMEKLDDISLQKGKAALKKMMELVEEEQN